MTASVRRRTPLSRALLALAGVAVLALLAIAVMLLGGARTDADGLDRPEAHPTTVTAVGDADRAPTAIHPFRQQPSTRARNAAFAVLASVVVVAAWVFGRLRLTRPGRLRTLSIVGLPPGRAPPALRIA